MKKPTTRASVAAFAFVAALFGALPPEFSTPAFAQDKDAARRAKAAVAAANKKTRPTKPPTPMAPAAPNPAEPPPGVPDGMAAAPGETPEREPPGASGPLPTNMDRIAQATDVPYRPKPAAHLVKFNLQDADLAELVNHISGLTGKRFIYGAKVRQVKATVVSPQPVTLAEAYQAFLSILEINGMTVVPHGRFLKIVDSGGVVQLGTPVVPRGAPIPDEERYMTRLYRLSNVPADQVAAVLAKFKSKEGDISVYAPGQLLIITDTGTQIRRMVRIIEDLDVGGAGQQMWIEPIHYGAAPEVAARISELYELGKAKPDGSGSGGLIKVLADEQTNSIIVVGTEDAYLRLLELLKRLDTRPTGSGKVRVLPLQHADAEELSKTLQQVLAGTGRGAKGAAPGAQPAGAVEGMFEGEVKVTADKSTNSLIITSEARDYAALRMVIDDLDQPRRQVFIEAVIMDLSVADSTDLGLSFHGGAPVDVGGGSDTLLLGGFQAGKSTLFPADPSLLQGFAVGARGPDLENTNTLLGTGVSIPAFGVVLNALASSGKSNILATPHVIATDNVAAEINIGENIPLQENLGGALGGLGALAGAQGAQGGLPTGLLGGLGGLGGFAAPRQDVGIKIKVTPHINKADQVRLEIDTESSARGASSGALGAVAIIKRTANTTVVVEDQQTVVIGGLMREEYVDTKEKIPVLGDLPVLGFLFRKSRTEKKKTNLLLILTPHVIRDQNDLRTVFERKMQERQEFLDRYFVFSGTDWKPPRDYSRANGLVEEVRKTYFKLDEAARLEEEGRPAEELSHEPSPAIELSDEVHQGGKSGGGAAGKKSKRAKDRPAKRKGRAELAPAKAEQHVELQPAFRIQPMSRSVNVETIQ